MSIAPRSWLAALLVAGSSLLTACTQVSREQVVSWREAVVAARDQSAATFQATNELIREDQLQRVVKLPAITEADLTPALDSASVGRWMAALDALATYAAAVDRLLAPELPMGVGESLRKTGEQLGVTADADLLKGDRALSGAIGSLGGLLVGAYAQTSAQKIMLQTDPAVTATVQRMADMLYVEIRPTPGAAPVAGGVLVTVADAWDNQLALIVLKYRKETTESGREPVAREYAAALERKAAALEAIRALRVSLLQLGAAHTAAAQGRSTDIQVVIASIRQETAIVTGVLADIRAHAAHH